MKKQQADDLFEKSSMTFGEHLDELRKALAKALIWLGIGTVFGLMLADRIVQYIETPLKSAIRTYYVERAKIEFKEANGVEPNEELATWMTENSMMPERAFVLPDSIADLLKQSGEESTETESAVTSAVVVPAATDPVADSKGSTSKLSQSPWAGVDTKQLYSLKPFILWQPIPNKLIALTSMEPFMMWLKAGLIAGFVFGAPGIFWHVWQFFAAGLYPHERRYVYWYLPLSLLLFFAGVALAFFVIFQMVLAFLIGYTASLDVEFAPRLNDYMSFAMILPLGFGLAFQLPIIMLGLHRFGVISIDTYVSQWRTAVLVISFLAMVLTPSDPYSMIGLAIPMIFLYFLGIGLCHYMPRGAGIGAPAIDP